MLHRDGNHTPCADQWRCLFCKDFNIACKIVLPANNDNVLHPASDEQVTVMDKTQITRAHVKFTGCVACNLTAKGMGGFFRAVPESLRHMRACNPDFACPIRPAIFESFGINNGEFRIDLTAATTDDSLRFICVAAWYDDAIGQLRAIHIKIAWPVWAGIADHDGALCQSIMRHNRA